LEVTIRSYERRDAGDVANAERTGDSAVQIGALVPLTRPGWVEVGRHLLAGLGLAVREVNDAGGIAGRPLELVIRDTPARLNPPSDGVSGRTDRITGIPAVFVRGRLDIASPLGVAWRLAQQLPLATLHVAEDEDHGGADTTHGLLIQATNRFAQ
jgi:pimeloyl-ACP methyl ester carboxylesterase